MKPYFAIIKDSFREALASRILWALLGLITATLIGLSPFHWKSTLVAQVTSGDIRNLNSLVAKIKYGEAPNANPLDAHLFDQLTPETKELMNASEDDPRAVFRLQRAVANDLNEAIRKADFYRPELWGDRKLAPEADKLIANPNRSETERRLLNRFALESVLAGQLRPVPAAGVTFRYFPFDTDIGPGLSRRMAEDLLGQWVIGFMIVVVGFFGIFAAILVTAPIVPNLLESGSLYVLLSKPISRPLLFLSKFVGGCAFVLINAAYLIVGIWLILGLRFGFWNARLLWGIPLFLFSFAIFYSVSATAGLIWRSSVMAVVATIVFWMLCTLVGVLRGWCEATVIFPERITRIFIVDEDPIVLRSNGHLSEWQEGAWVEIFSPQQRPRFGPPMLMQTDLLGPVYDQGSDQLVAIDPKWSQPRVLAGARADGWPRVDIGPGPRNTQAIMLVDGKPTVVADRGIYNLGGQFEENEGINIFGFKIATPAVSQTSNQISTDSASVLQGDMLAGVDPSDNAICVAAMNVLRRYEMNEDGLFDEVAQTKLDSFEATSIAISAGLIGVSDAVGTIRLYDASSLQQLSEHTPFPRTPVRQLALANDGGWLAVLFENQQVWLYDTVRKQPRLALNDQGSLCAVAFRDTKLLVGDVFDRITAYEGREFRQTHRWDPEPPMVRWLYRYILRPLHAVFPKPGELENTMRYAVTGKDTGRLEGPTGRAIVKFDPWQPLYSNFVFIVGVLMLGCVYVYRKDF